MSSPFEADFAATAAADHLAAFGQSVELIAPDGDVSAVTAIIIRRPSRQEFRINHRVRVEPVGITVSDAVAASLGDGAGVVIDDDAPFDFVDWEQRSGGLQTALCERLTILETGGQTTDL